MMSDEATRLKLILNIIVLTISLYGVSSKRYEVRSSTIFDKLMMDTLSPIQSAIGYVKSRISYYAENYIFLVNASLENQALRNHVAVLERQVFEMGELARENKRLKDLLKFGEDIPSDKILAQVVGWDSSGNWKMLRINKGSTDGIEVESPVVTADGLVGYIIRTSFNYSDILTILDQNNRVDALVDRTRSHGIIEGYSNSRCIMKYVTRTEPVKLNDQVLTSGLGNIYPKGIKVGQISKIERESYGITQFIEVTPAVDLTRLEEVVVLVAKEEDSTEGDPIGEKLEVQNEE